LIRHYKTLMQFI